MSVAVLKQELKVRLRPGVAFYIGFFPRYHPAARVIAALRACAP